MPNFALIVNKSKFRPQRTLQDITITPFIIERNISKAVWSARFHNCMAFVELFSLSSGFSDLARVFSELVALLGVYENR